MTDFFIYLSYSTLALAALYLLYKVSMSYETLHRLNRVLLLGFVVLSAVLPLLPESPDGVSPEGAAVVVSAGVSPLSLLAHADAITSIRSASITAVSLVKRRVFFMGASYKLFFKA